MNAGERIWEILGTCCGLLGAGSIGLQLLHAYTTRSTNGLSLPALVMFLVVLCFWVLYGWHFKRPAIWLTNGLGAMLQGALIAARLAYS